MATKKKGTKVTEGRVNGKFAPGVLGNPKGRPMGAKNRITQAKQDLEVLLRENVLNVDDIKEVWQAMVTEAKAGNVSAGKIVLDKVISQATTSEDISTEGSALTIKIKNLTFDLDDSKVIEGDFTTEE